MQNPILNSDHSEMTCREWEAIARRTIVGHKFGTNIPGTVGHNYANWEVVSIADLVIDGKVEVVSRRVS